MRTGAPRCGGAKRNDHLLLHVRACMRTDQSFGDDTHAVATGLHLGMRARTSQRCVVLMCRWVESLAY